MDPSRGLFNWAVARLGELGTVLGELSSEGSTA